MDPCKEKHSKIKKIDIKFLASTEEKQAGIQL
jgi:hypothetical protein